MPLGVCRQKCPKEEHDFRVKNCLIHTLESTQPFENVSQFVRRADPQRMCKEYVRFTATKVVNFNDIRDVETLLDTVRYLESLEREFDGDSQWPVVYEYMEDRFRAIRQDLIVQNQHRCPNAAAIYETLIRFYLRSLYRSKNLSTSTFVEHNHCRELNETMQRWFTANHRNEPDILSILSTSRTTLSEKGNDLVMNVLSAFISSDFVNFFRIVGQLDKYQKYAIIEHVKNLRLIALQVLASASRNPVAKWPLNKVADMLGYSNHDHCKQSIQMMYGEKAVTGDLVQFHGLHLQSSVNLDAFYWISL